MKSTVVMILVPLSIQFNLTNMYWGYLCAKQFAESPIDIGIHDAHSLLSSSLSRNDTST